MDAVRSWSVWLLCLHPRPTHTHTPRSARIPRNRSKITTIIAPIFLKRAINNLGGKGEGEGEVTAAPNLGKAGA